MTDPHELSVTRYIDAPPEKVWEVYTTRKDEFFCPKPWRAEVVEEDHRAGGRSRINMYGPQGEKNEVNGTILEVVPHRRIVSTDAFVDDWQPAGPFIVAITTFEPEGKGTRYTAAARHWTAEAMKQHEDMGFHEGWGAVVEQLAQLCEDDTK
ncbi:SRPBCC family protein [Pacificimonas sp. ICDLI1SI03]